MMNFLIAVSHSDLTRAATVGGTCLVAILALCGIIAGLYKYFVSLPADGKHRRTDPDGGSHDPDDDGDGDGDGSADDDAWAFELAHMPRSAELSPAGFLGGCMTVMEGTANTAHDVLTETGVYPEPDAPWNLIAE